jgi:uncharacterized protein YggU (UPF0235/DUF167 family)
MDKSETSLTIEVKVTPRAKKSALEKTGAGYRAWVRAAPDKGKANKELIKLMADYFSLPPSRIHIIRGEKSGSKLLIVEQIS